MIWESLYPMTLLNPSTRPRTLVARRPGALLVTPGPFFLTRARQFALLAERYSIAAMYSRREYVEAGGLMSYGSSTAEYYRQLGIYAGKILGGVKPSDLPVVIPTKFELVINLKAANALGLTIPASKFEFVLNLQTARALGIEVPPAVLSIVDEGIE